MANLRYGSQVLSDGTWLDIADHGASTPSIYLDRTQDFGLRLNSIGGADYLSVFYFKDIENGIYSTCNEIFVTNDSGNTWRTTGSIIYPKGFVSLNFIHDSLSYAILSDNILGEFSFARVAKDTTLITKT